VQQNVATKKKKCTLNIQMKSQNTRLYAKLNEISADFVYYRKTYLFLILGYLYVNCYKSSRLVRTHDNPCADTVGACTKFIRRGVGIIKSNTQEYSEKQNVLFANHKHTTQFYAIRT